MIIDVPKTEVGINEQTDALFWLSKQLNSRGIIIRATDHTNSKKLSPRADFTVVQSYWSGFPYPEREGILDQFDRIILFGPTDPGTCVPLRTALNHPNVKRAVTTSSLPLDLLSEFGRTYHFQLLKDANPHYETPEYFQIPVSEENYEKIALFPAFHGFRGWEGVTRQWQERKGRVKPNEVRDWDLAFMGRTSHSDSKSIQSHRVDMVCTLLPHYHKRILTDRLWAYGDYCNNLLKSKICLSPWGCSELCGRDAEAMFAGCVLIKPLSDHVITQFPYFISGQTYVSVKLDWSDLIEKIDDVLANWDDYYEMRRSNQERIYQESSTEFLVDYLVSILTF